MSHQMEKKPSLDNVVQDIIKQKLFWFVMKSPLLSW